MEEFDELLPTPDAEGSLELSHRAWLEVDEVVWTMGLEIIKLSLSYNRLKHIACDTTASKGLCRPLAARARCVRDSRRERADSRRPL